MSVCLCFGACSEMQVAFCNECNMGTPNSLLFLSPLVNLVVGSQVLIQYCLLCAVSNVVHKWAIPGHK